MEKIIKDIEIGIANLLKSRPSHLIDESLIKHSIVEILLEKVKNSNQIENLQVEKTCNQSNIRRCDIFFQYNGKKYFLELKLNRLVLKINSDKLSGMNEFKGDIQSILKDFDQLGHVKDGEKYLLLLMQSKGIKINRSIKLSLNEYCEKELTSESKRLLNILSNNDNQYPLIFKKSIPNFVNGESIPFELMVFKVTK
ncbi:MAG: hypothetical protein GY714_16600 [Desulfobacterales bacterium]|nr:hypothetical protein [Desulfobacterales bacterium]